MKLLGTLRGFVLVVGIAGAASASANLIDTTHGTGAGSFELQTAPYIETHPDFMRLPPGSTVITGWSVGGNGVDYLTEPGHFARAGTFSVDLAAQTAGSVSTSFPTAIGENYTLTFQAYGGIPSFVHTGQVSVGDLVGQQFTPANVASAGSASYTSYDFQFIALATSTTLTFSIASSPDGFGPVIDAVSVVATNPVPSLTRLSLIALVVLLVSAGPLYARLVFH